MTVAEMRKRYNSDEWLFFVTIYGEFFKQLPTIAERRTFAEAFPAPFHKLFGFFSHASDEWPASTMYELRRIFRRPAEEFMKLLHDHPPRVPFDPPDVSVLPYPKRYVALALARGRWWEQNGWPMTQAEIRWMWSNGE